MFLGNGRGFQGMLAGLGSKQRNLKWAPPQGLDRSLIIYAIIKPDPFSFVGIPYLSTSSQAILFRNPLVCLLRLPPLTVVPHNIVYTKNCRRYRRLQKMRKSPSQKANPSENHANLFHQTKHHNLHPQQSLLH